MISCTGVEIDPFNENDYYSNSGISNNFSDTVSDDSNSNSFNSNSSNANDLGDISDSSNNGENISGNDDVSDNDNGVSSDSVVGGKDFVSNDSLLDDFDFYFGKNTDSINLYGVNSPYDKKKNLTEVTKGSEFKMSFPSDFSFSKQSNGDWNFLWDSFYNGMNSNIHDKNSEKNNIKVRFISIDRDIPSDADNNYINKLFFGYLSTESFKRLGVDKWKPYENETLKSVLLKKGIVSSFVYSGAVLSSVNREKLMNFFVFTFYNPVKNKLVFLLISFEFHIDAYSSMESDNIIENYYRNWISLISTFNFF